MELFSVQEWSMFAVLMVISPPVTITGAPDMTSPTRGCTLWRAIRGPSARLAGGGWARRGGGAKMVRLTELYVLMV